MSKKPQKRHFKALGEATSVLLDPILRKRAGLNIELMDNWAELVGADMAQNTIPLKIIWARRAQQDDVFQPATLVVACEGFSAMKLTHETGVVIQRINAFFGYTALNRIKVEQKQVRIQAPLPYKRPVLDKEQEETVLKMTANVEDDKLRQSLVELGKSVFAERKT